MQFNWFENTSPGAKLVLAFALMVCVAVIFSLIALVIAIPLFQMGPAELMNAMSNIHHNSNINVLKYFQVIQSVGLFVVPPLLLAVLFGYRPAQYLKLQTSPKIAVSFITLLVVFSCLPFVNFTEMLNANMKFPESLHGLELWMKTAEDNAAVLSEKFLTVHTIGGLLFNLLMMAIIPAIGEEFVFRGVFQRLFTEMFKNYHLGILVSAIVFSAFHLQFYGFVPRMLLGMAFGYLFVWSGNLWLPVLAHFFNNAMGVIFYYFYYNGQVGNSLQEIGTTANSWPLAIISLVITLSLLYIFKKKSQFALVQQKV